MWEIDTAEDYIVQKLKDEYFAREYIRTHKPIRHGHWEYNPKDAFEVMFELPKCSVCGHESSDALNYCSNCGAKMDEVE